MGVINTQSSLYVYCEALIPIKGDYRYLRKTLESLEIAILQGLRVCIVYSELDFLSLEEGIDHLTRKNFRFIDGSGLSLAEKLNLGVTTSNAEFILRIDADDLITDSRIEKQVNFLRDNPQVAVVGSRMRYIDTEGKFIGESRKFNLPPKQLFQVGCLLSHPSVLMRRDEIISCGSYIEFSKIDNISIAEDFFLWARVISKYEIYILDECLTDYRIHSLQTSKRFDNERHCASLLIRGSLILGIPCVQTHPNELQWNSSSLKSMLREVRNVNSDFALIWQKDFSNTVVKSLLQKKAWKDLIYLRKISDVFLIIHSVVFSIKMIRNSQYRQVHL